MWILMVADSRVGRARPRSRRADAELARRDAPGLLVPQLEPIQAAIGIGSSPAGRRCGLVPGSVERLIRWRYAA